MSTDLRDRLQSTLGGSYSLERELGGGAMSRVFIAEDRALGRQVVVKVLPPELAGAVSAERFKREIAVAAQLQHPHVVPVLSAGDADGIPYYTMPLVEGESLRQRLARGLPTVHEGVQVVRAVASALDYAHARGIVHRDIKPDNVLLANGVAVVTDFGIAKALGAAVSNPGDGALTGMGVSIGTPAYMAPEQAAADPNLDGRADLYALGCLAYELFTGRAPFGLRPPSLLMQAHIHERPEPLEVLRPDLPAALAALVMKCLEKDPSRRPATAGEFVRKLDQVPLSGELATAPLRSASRRIRLDRVTALNAVVVAGAVLFVLFEGAQLLGIGREAGARVAAPPPLVAVLPFESSGDVRDSLFAAGLADAVQGKLAALGDLRVLDRRAVQRAADTAATVQQAGMALGADFVLRATLRWARAQDGQPIVQLAPVLVSVHDGTTKWAGEPRVVSPRDPFAAQSALAGEVAAALGLALAPEERRSLGRALSADPEAYAAYVRGERLADVYATTNDAAVLERMLHEYERAVALDPSFGLAVGRSAYSLGMLYLKGKRPLAVVDSAERLARRSLELAPHNVGAYQALANLGWSKGGYNGLRILLDSAVRANPSSAALLRFRAYLSLYEGDTSGVWAAYEEAMRLAPDDRALLLEAGRSAQWMRRWDDADRLFRRVLVLDPSSDQSRLALVHDAYARGDIDGMARLFRDYRAKGGPLSILAMEYPRRADAALRAEHDALTLDAIGARTIEDSLVFWREKGRRALDRGDTLALRGHAERILRATARPLPASGSPLMRMSFLINRTWGAAAAGDESGTRKAIVELLSLPQLRDLPNGVNATVISCIVSESHALLGDVEGMLPWLERCITRPFGNPATMVRVEPSYARVRSDPRVTALLRRIGG